MQMTRESQLETQWLCQRVLLQLMLLIDSGDAEGAMAMMVPDAKWLRQDEMLQGTEAIRAVIKGRPATRIVRHHLCNIVITVHAEHRASSRAYYTAYSHDGGSADRVGERVGDHHAEFIRTAQGWRVSYLRTTRLFAITERVAG